MTLARLEQVIDRIGASYIADLRTLSETFGQFYETQLTAKDAQIAELSRGLEAAEGQRDALAAQLDEIKRTSARYVATLRALSEELNRHLDGSEGSVPHE